jgi:hypothetical protein
MAKLRETTPFGGYGGKKWRESEKVEGNPRCVTDNAIPRPFFASIRRSQALPGALGSACDRRI